MSRYLAFTGPEWNPLECDCPWETVTLPDHEVFKYQPYDNKPHIFRKIHCLKRYDGKWESKNYRMDIVFLPKKKSYFANSAIPMSNYGLIVNSMKNHYLLLPRSKKTSPKFEKKQIVDFFNNLGYERHIVYKDGKTFKKLRYKPLKEFIAQNYGDEFKREVKKIEDIQDIMLMETPRLIYSPYMTNKQQIDHIFKKIEKINKLKKKYQEKYKEFERVIDKIRVNVLHGTEDILDEIGDYCRENFIDYNIKMDLSILIYNYSYVENLRNSSKNGLHLYKKYNMIPLMIYNVLYDKFVTLHRASKTDFIDIREWKDLKCKYLVNDKQKSYIKIREGVGFVNLEGGQTNATNRIMKETDKRTNNFEIFYLIQRQLFGNDIISVNLPDQIEMNGSVRVNPLCAFKIYL